MKKKLLCALLTLTLCTGLLPATAFAAGTDTGKAIQLGTSGISDYDSTNGYDYIYMGYWTAPDENTTSGPIKWRVLDDRTNTRDSGLFLLSDVLLGTGRDGGVYFDNSEPYSSAWQNSSAQAWCKDFAGIEGSSVTDAFTTGELRAVLATTKSDQTFDNYSGSKNILSGDKVFFLSAEEANKEAYGFRFDDDDARVANYGTSVGAWWLRSPYGLSHNADRGVIVFGYGYLWDYYVNRDWAARPAFNLDPNSVLFTSAADGSVQVSFGAAAGYDGNEWKLTLKDSNSFADATVDNTAVAAGEKLTVNHKALNDFGTGYTNVTAMLTDSRNNILYYGSINDDTSATSSTIAIPAGLAAGEYTLSVYGEDWNGEKMTDYATGTPYTTQITVNRTNKTAVALTASMAEKTYDGHAIANPTVTAKDDETVAFVSGYNYIWQKADGTVLTEAPAAAGDYKVTVSVLETDANYAGETTVDFSIGKADPDMDVLYIPITSSGKTLEDAELTLGANSTSGTLAWVLPEITSVTANTEYEWKFTPEDTVNYKEMTGTITLWIKTASSGGGGSSTSVKADNDQVTIDTSRSSVSEKDMDKAIDKAVENDADEIVIDTNKNKVTLPEGMTENIADQTDADLVVETKNGTVTIPNSTLEDLDAEGKVTVEVTKDKVAISDEDGELSDIGKIEVTVPYEENSETGNVAVEVTKADGTKEVIEDVYDGEGSVTFEIDGSVTFVIIDDYVPGAEIPVAPVTPAENPFKDVSETDWFYKAVMYVSEDGLMSGVDADHFGPSWNTTRGMITTILWRMEGKPAAGEVPFADVKADMYYADAIAWAAENGIVSGYDAVTFGPDDNITREQLASILWRYAKYKGYDVSVGEDTNILSYEDAFSISEYAIPAMQWACGAGIISGNDDGTLNPSGHAQRAHAAQMLMKFDKNVK